MDYYAKYIKYKNKYISLKTSLSLSQDGGTAEKSQSKCKKLTRKFIEESDYNKCIILFNLFITQRLINYSLVLREPIVLREPSIIDSVSGHGSVKRSFSNKESNAIIIPLCTGFV